MAHMLLAKILDFKNVHAARLKAIKSFNLLDNSLHRCDSSPISETGEKGISKRRGREGVLKKERKVNGSEQFKK